MPLGLLLFWSAITLLFDGFVLWSLYRHVRATGYAQLPGVITHSEVEVHRGDGTTYGVDVKYEYRVGHETFIGERYRYGDTSSTDDYAERVVAAPPVGKQVPVYYNPYDPADSVLLTGVPGSDLFLLLFLTPFNAVMLLGWSFVFTGARRRAKGLPAGVPMVRRGPRLHARLDLFGPLGAMVGIAGILAFIAIFPIAFGLGMHPSVPTMAAVWTLILGLSGVAGGSQWLRRESGQGDLILNEMDRTLALPHTFGRKEDVYVPFGTVQGIEIETREEKGEGTTWHYGPIVAFTDAEGRTRREKIAEWSSREDADEFAAWLREQLGNHALSDVLAGE